MRTAYDAMVVGAGPAGCAAAIVLARAGWSVALVEKQHFPRRKVCGECIAASNLPLLQQLGIGAALATLAGPELRQVALLHRDAQRLADLPAAASPQWPWGRALGRETLDTLLLEQARAAGVQVWQPWSLQSIGGGAGDWTWQLRASDSSGAATLRASVAIAANGSWEPLPGSAGATRRSAHRSSDLLAFKANFRNASLRDGLLPVLLLDGGYGGMVVGDAGMLTLACCVRRHTLDALRRAAPGQRAGDVVERWLRAQCAGVRAALRGATRQGGWLAAGPLNPGVRLTCAAPGKAPLRIGNAAGEAHPLLGEGMSMALQSAMLLCGELLRARGTAPLAEPGWQHDAERRYNAAWRRAFSRRLRLAAAFAQLAMRPAGASALMALAQAWPGLLTRGARFGGKVDSVADLQALLLPEPHA